MTANTTKTIIEDYLAAYESQDISDCVQFFTEDATLKFLFSTYKGHSAILKWHQERINAKAKLIGVDYLHVDDDHILANVVATSKKLKLFGIKSLKGTAEFTLQDGKITSAKFSPRKGVSSHQDWQFDQ